MVCIHADLFSSSELTVAALNGMKGKNIKATLESGVLMITKVAMANIAPDYIQQSNTLLINHRN